MALVAAVHRMSAVIYQAKRGCDSEEGCESDITEMVLEAGAEASCVALEVLSRLGIGVAMPDDEIGHSSCYRQWLSWIDHTGVQIQIEDDDPMENTA